MRAFLCEKLRILGAGIATWSYDTRKLEVTFKQVVLFNLDKELSQLQKKFKKL